MLPENLKVPKVTPDDIKAKLRAEDVTDLSQIQAEVLKTKANIVGTEQ